MKVVSFYMCVVTAKVAGRKSAMNELFNPENRFWNFMNKITDVFVLGILWFLFSIPVITAGAATTSLYQFTLKQADDEEGYVFKSFVRAFTKNFKQVSEQMRQLFTKLSQKRTSVYLSNIWRTCWCTDQFTQFESKYKEDLL